MKILLSKKVAVLLGLFVFSAAGSAFAGQKETCAGADTAAECGALIKLEMNNGFPKVKHICEWKENTCKPKTNNKKDKSE